MISHCGGAVGMAIVTAMFSVACTLYVLKNLGKNKGYHRCGIIFA